MNSQSAALKRANQPANEAMKSTVNRIFALFMVYSWAIQFTQGDSVYRLLPDEISYYFFVIPSAVLFVAGLFYIALQYGSLDRTSLLIGLFGGIVLVVATARSDLGTVRTIGLLCLCMIVIFRVRPQISIDLINILFVISLPITTSMFLLGYSDYTFIPGLGSQSYLWWRVSAYPSAAEGGLLALAVLLLNLNLKGQRFRPFMIGLSAYMLLLAGNRTAIVAALFTIIYLALRSNGLLRTKTPRILFLLTILAAFVVSVFASQILFYLPFADTPFVREVLLRQEVVNTRFDAGDQLGTAAIRSFIINQHLSLFAGNPWFGAGTFEFQQLTSGYGALDNISAGSEAYLSALFARVGISAAIMLYALFLGKHDIDRNKLDMATCAKIALFIGMITYGSFVNPYDIIFLLLLLGITGGVYVPQIGQRPAPPMAPGRRTA